MPAHQTHEVQYQRKNMTKKINRLIIGIAIAGLFLWLIFRGINLNELLAAFNQANSFLILLSVVAFLIGYGCRIERWRIMLILDNPNISWKECFGPMFASVAANNILPFRAGDILRAFGFNSRLRISTATSLTTLVVERLLDLLMVIAFLGLALRFFNLDSSMLLGVGGSLLLIFAGAIAFVLIAPNIFSPIAFLVARMLSKISPNIGRQAEHQFKKVFAALSHVSHGPNMIKLILWSWCAWFFEGIVFWCAAKALPSLSEPLASWVALPIGTLSTTIPSTPGYVGTFDFFTSQAMITLGNSIPAAAAYALLVHIILWLPPTLIGGIYLSLYPVKKQDYPKAVEL